MNFTSRYIKTSTQPIHLIQCKDEEGIDCFYFLMCPEFKLELMKNSSEEIVDMNDYGKIVHSGYGIEPSEEDIRHIKEKYNHS